MNQCFSVLVKGLVGPCTNVSLFLWRVSVQLCKKKFYLLKWSKISQTFSTSCRSAVHKDAWLISAKQELFLYQTHSGISLIHLNSCTVPWQSQHGLSTVGLLKDIILLCPQFGCAIPAMGLTTQKSADQKFQEN